MKSIDFLPEIYRQRDSLRRAQLWWVLVVALFGSAIGASAIAQAWQRHELVVQLDALMPEFAGAEARVQELATIQLQAGRAGQQASLYTLLKNPWPRTQLLAEILRPLNEGIRLTRMVVAEEEVARAGLPLTARSSTQNDEAAAKASPAEKDFARLQDEIDRRQTVIEIEGVTKETPVLHDYVSQISRSPLIANAAIKSLETALTNHQTHTRFTLRLIVCPGYGQRTETPTSVVDAPAGRHASGGGQ